MKRGMLLIACALTFALSSLALAQISNLQINGSSTSLAMTSGDSVTWSYNVNPVGATAFIEIWYDVNGNGTIDPSSDVLWQSFTQTDGDTTGGNGPSDDDMLANGVVTLGKTSIGLAPGKYVLRYSQGGASLSVTGTVTAFASPTRTISGAVTVPAGKSAQNIFVGAQPTAGYDHGPGWWALTDASGNYQIAINSDTAGGPWQVYVGTNPYPPDIISPQGQDVSLSSSPTGVNFTLSTAAAQIAGTVRDEQGNPLPGVSINSYGSTGNPESANSNASGVYQIGLAQSDLSLNTSFSVTAYFERSNGTTTMLDAEARTGAISPGDSVVKNLVAYTANATISGTVTVNGLAPGFPMQLAAFNADSAQSVTTVDASTGAFSFPVSNKISDYQIIVIGGSSFLNNSTQTYHPGQSGIVVDFSTEGVAKTPTSLPLQWSLSQNYPNPFNPSTQISYTVPSRAHVTVSVYNILGVKVAELVNADRAAGKYDVVFDATNLTSGVYFYRLQASNFLQTRKMILLK